jgi:MFS family permease
VSPPATYTKLAREPDYLRFVAASTVARIADHMFAVAIVLLTLERTGSAVLAGAIVAAITFPSLITAPLLGGWLDLHGRRKALMMLDQALAGGAILFLALGVGRVPDLVVVAVALLPGLTWPLSFGGFTSLIPTIVPDALLPRANALEATSLNLSLIAGPLLAGGISAAFSPEAAVLTEVALTIAVLPLLMGFDVLDSGPKRVAGSLMEVVRDGLRVLVDSPPLRGTTLAGMVSLIGPGIFTVAFPLWCVEELGAETSAAGLLWAAFALGSTVGALALVGVQRRLTPQRVVILGFLAFGVLMLPWSLAASLPVAIVLVAVASFADGPALSATFAVRQEWAPRDLQGQIFTTAAGMKVGCFALGSAVAGPLVTGAGATGALLVAAGLNFAAAGTGWVAGRFGGGEPLAVPEA